MSAHQNHRFLVAFPKDTGTPEDKQRRRFAASPIDTATPERGLAAFPIGTATPKEKQRLLFCSFPHRHGIYDAKTTRKTMRKRREKRRDDQLEPPDPQIINGNPSLHIREKAPHGTRSSYMLPRIIASRRVACMQTMPPRGYSSRTVCGGAAAAATVAARARPRVEGILMNFLELPIKLKSDTLVLSA